MTHQSYHLFPPMNCVSDLPGLCYHSVGLQLMEDKFCRPFWAHCINFFSSLTLAFLSQGLLVAAIVFNFFILITARQDKEDCTDISQTEAVKLRIAWHLSSARTHATLQARFLLWQICFFATYLLQYYFAFILRSFYFIINCFLFSLNHSMTAPVLKWPV